MSTKFLLANAKTHTSAGFGKVIFHDLLPTLALHEIFEKYVGRVPVGMMDYGVISRPAHSSAMYRAPYYSVLIVYLT